MKKSLFINECRISLQSVHKLKALKYSSKGLSSKHKKYIERTLASELQRIAIFDGNILFCLVDQQTPIEEEKDTIKSFLTRKIREFQETLLQPVTLLQLPQSTVERLVFSLIVTQAKSRGIYKLRGRTLFKPSPEKKGHYGVDITLVTEDDSIKLYLIPTLVVLTEIAQSKRPEMGNASTIGLCSFREECNLANEKGSCKFFVPGHLGYFSERKLLSQLPTESKERFVNDFKDCPKIEVCKQVISVKATKGAKNVQNYPAYAIQLHFGDNDFTSQQKASFRDATLMPSAKRWEETNLWINRIFFHSNETTLNQANTTFRQGGVSLPISILLNNEHTVGENNNQPYEPLYFPDQKIIVDQQNPKAFSYGGGYQFNKYGAYDRKDSNRPFEKIAPFMILPNDKAIVHQTRELMKGFSDGYAPKQNAWGDKSFEGLNQADGQAKYNVEFVNPWDTEEVLLISDASDLAYLEAAEDVIRQWKASKEVDPNKIILIIKPPETSPSNSPTLYYDLKSKLDGEGIPNQFITVDTLAKVTSPRVAFGPILQSLWLNIYAKTGGIPWRIESEIGNVHCFIGIGFGLNPSYIGEHIYAGVAHIFDKYGNWVDIASDSQEINKSERDSIESNNYLEGTASFKISQETTESIVYKALSLYKDKQSVSELPAQNIVLHKLGRVYESEVLGFLKAIKRINGNLDTCRLGVLQIEQDHLRRLYGTQDNEKLDRTVFRGMGLVINRNKLLLATTGRSSKNYFGIGTPNPLLLTSIEPSPELLQFYSCKQEQFYNIKTLGNHVMALTQLHWGSTKDNIRQPITTLYAQKVAELISKMETKIDTWTSIHRPWFL